MSLSNLSKFYEFVSISLNKILLLNIKKNGNGPSYIGIKIKFIINLKIWYYSIHYDLIITITKSSFSSKYLEQTFITTSTFNFLDFVVVIKSLAFWQKNITISVF